MTRSLLTCVLSVVTTGCAIDREGALRIAEDGGTGGVDTFVPPGRDAGPDPRDAGPVDGGPGDLDGGPPPTPDGGPPPSCIAGSSRCAPDGTERFDCVDGFSIDTVHCARGCDSRTDDCRPRTSCAADPPLVAVPGMRDENTCTRGDDHYFDPAPSDDTCTSSYPADGEDALVRFELDRPTHLRLRLRDYDASNDLDAILYVRQGGCDNRATQIACDDDSGDWMGNRASEIDRTFEPGEYFVVMDIHDASSGWEGCGTLRLEIEVR